MPWGFFFDGGGGRSRRGVSTAVWGALCSGLPTYLLEPLEPLSSSSSRPPPFWRGAAYGSPDDAERFLFFAVASLELLLWAGRSPDVIHCHDWQSASVPLLLEAGDYRRKRSATFGGGLGFFGGSESSSGSSSGESSSLTGDGPLATTGTVLTIHNLAFPGRTNPSLLSPAISGERKGACFSFVGVGREGKDKERERERERQRERERDSEADKSKEEGKEKLTLFDSFKKNKKKKQELSRGTPRAPRPRAGSPTPSWTARAPEVSTEAPMPCCCGQGSPSQTRRRRCRRRTLKRSCRTTAAAAAEGPAPG